jgi:predicted DCC family thiol-disulfide oxidoreductase YuxK
MKPDTPRNEAIRPALIYDANCALCEATKNFLSRWDRRHAILYLHFQESQARALFPFLAGMEHLEAMYFMDKTGKSWKGMEAAREILRYLPLGWPLAWLFYLPGVPLLADRLYTWIARNRYLWFGHAKPR